MSHENVQETATDHHTTTMSKAFLSLDFSICLEIDADHEYIEVI